MILYDNTLVYAHTHQYHYLEEGLLTYMYDSSVTDHYYLLTDNVGSVTHVVNGEGGTVFDAGYDAWGGQVVTNNDIGFHRGYGGHEMLPQYRLVNMHTFRHTDELQLNRDLIKNKLHHIFCKSAIFLKDYQLIEL